METVLTFHRERWRRMKQNPKEPSFKEGTDEQARGKELEKETRMLTGKGGET
jgi:hypothetical protein